MGDRVQLYVYDLTNGVAAQLSPMLIGKRIEGVWHTSIVVGKVEHFFGCGLLRAVPGSTHFGAPLKVLDLGTTEVSAAMREELLLELAPRYGPDNYSLLKHNCNNFSNEFAMLLCGEGIPEYILNQAKEVLDTPMGQMLMPMLMKMEGQLAHNTAGGFSGGANAFAAATASASASAASSAAAAAARPAPALRAPTLSTRVVTPAVIHLPAAPAPVDAAALAAACAAAMAQLATPPPAATPTTSSAAGTAGAGAAAAAAPVPLDDAAAEAEALDARAKAADAAEARAAARAAN